MMRGTGKAEIFVMLAHPVGHAKSPGIFNEIFEARGLDSLMVPLSCRPQMCSLRQSLFRLQKKMQNLPPLLKMTARRLTAARISGQRTKASSSWTRLLLI